MEIKIKILNTNAVAPNYSRLGDAGLDLTATSFTFDEEGNAVYGIGIAVEIPLGYMGLIFPRSSVSKKELLLSNSVGVIDSNYRGELIVKFKPFKSKAKHFDPNKIFTQKKYYEIGERIAQLIILPIPQINIKIVDELSETNRGEAGFGSSGN